MLVNTFAVIFDRMQRTFIHKSQIYIPHGVLLQNKFTQKVSSLVITGQLVSVL
jgi:hypothetical protein